MRVMHTQLEVRPDQPAAAIPPRQLVFFPARAFLAFGWLRAGIEKAIELDWWTGQEVQVFLIEHQDVALPFAVAWSNPVSAMAPAVAAAVLALELAIGTCLLTARRLRPALWAGIALNIVFVSFGVVTPSAFYLVLQFTLLLGLVACQASRTLRIVLVTTSALVIAAVLPYVNTLHPSEVIHDPALMLATIAALLGATQLIPLIDLTDSKR